MKENINVFVLTTEYHFLLAVNIVEQQYPASEFKNILVLTSERLSSVRAENLPGNLRVITMDVGGEKDLKGAIYRKLLTPSPVNIFVFTAYRDLETYLMCSAGHSVTRHLVQDGANFYFHIGKSVMWSRFKETLKIYRNLWRKGILLKRLILYKTHMADCSFIDRVWVTNPDLYVAPRFSNTPVSKIDLLAKQGITEKCCRYFGLERNSIHDALIYLSFRLTNEEAIAREISQLKMIAKVLKKPSLLVKLHPNATSLQRDLFTSAFGTSVVQNFIPAELLIAQSRNCYIVGTASAALYFANPACTYFTLIKIFQQLEVYPKWVDVKFPKHVGIIESINEISERFS
jgi:hypothetical protein